MNLIEDMQNEIKRVRKMERIYESIAEGKFAAKMMHNSVNKAKKAIASRDIAEMISVLEELEKYELW